MEPIVSPFFIYLLSFVSALKIAGIIAACLGAIAIVIGICTEAGNKSFGKDDSDYLAGKKARKIGVPILIVGLVIAIFLPPRNTLIAMRVAKFVTTDNLTKAIEASGNFKDTVKKDIIEIIEAMKGEPETK